MTRLLRVAAFGIAIAGLIDPAIEVSGASRARIAVVAQQPLTPPMGAARDRLARNLGTAFEIVPQLTSDAAAAIVIGDRYPDDPVPDALLAATVTTPSELHGVRIVHIDAPRDVPPATVIHLGVDLQTGGTPEQTTDVIATIGALEAGRASHTWTAGETRWRAEIDAVPVGDSPYVVQVRLEAQVRLKPDTTEPSDVVSGFSRTVSDVVVDARRAPFRVQFYDPRPSWATTFLRRALEGDARFQVAGTTFASRGVSVQTGGAVPLGDPRLDAADVVIAGGLDRLSAADARALDRFMRERGGAVVIVPDQKIDAGPVRDLIGGPAKAGHYQEDLVERLLEQPATLVVAQAGAPLQASELLVLRAPGPGHDVIARVPGADASPVIVTMPRGNGRLLLSGAMDAWRFRAADDRAFDRFWQTTVAGLAIAVAPAIDIRVDPPLLRPGERGDLTVRVRSRDAAVSASLDANPIRLVPEPESGVYHGRFTAGSAPGRSTIEVKAASPGLQAPALSASRTLLVQREVRRAPSASPPLSMLATSHRGIDVSPEHIADLERFIHGAVTAPQAKRILHPMRSTWWFLPFAACLSVEWWLRRRSGLR